MLDEAASHPKPESLELFMEGRLPDAERREVVRHLLGGCARCREITGPMWTSAGARPDDWRYDFASSFERILERVRAQEALILRERTAAPLLFAELERQPAARRNVLALNSQRFGNWALTELVIQRGRDAALESPEEATEWARLGHALAERLDEATYQQRLVRDLRARAAAVLGNALRVAGDYPAGDAAFAEAAALLEDGTGDPLEEAALLDLRASLRNAQRRFDEALRDLDRACRLYRQVGDEHLAGRVLASKAMVLDQRDHEGAGIPLLKRALSMLDAARDPRAVLAARHNLVYSLVAVGKTAEARQLLYQFRADYREVGSETDRLRLRWLEGKIEQAEGRLAEAEEAYQEVRAAFAERRLADDMAAAALDLATVYLEQGRMKEVQGLAGEILAIFRSLGVGREATAAIVLFQEAAARQEVSRQLLTELSAYLRRAARNPALRFEPGA